MAEKTVRIEGPLEIAKGRVRGHSAVAIPGRRDSVGTTALQDLTETGNTVLVRPNGTNIEIVSDDVADNGSATTGVRTVHIDYLDVNGDTQHGTYTMNGDTPVVIGTMMYDIQWMHTVTVGSNTVAEGNIQINDVATHSIVFEQISLGGNQSLSARYKIPNGYTGYIMGWHASSVTRKIDFKLRADVDRHERTLQTGVFNFQDAMVLEATPSGYRPFAVPLKIPAGGTVKISAQSFTGSGDAGGGFDLMLVEGRY